MAATASSTLSLEDFKPGERVWWDGNRSRFFATVVRTDKTSGELFLKFDYYPRFETVITSTGDNSDPDHSRIADWHKIPDVTKIQEGTLLSTNSGFFTWDKTGQTRFIFKVVKAEQGKVFLEKWGTPEYKTTLRGDNFSRTLEDALYEWEVESYEPVTALTGEQADATIETLVGHKTGLSADDQENHRKTLDEAERKVEMQHRLHLESMYASDIPDLSLDKLYRAANSFDVYTLMEGGHGPYSALELHYETLAGLVTEVIQDNTAGLPE